MILCEAFSIRRDFFGMSWHDRGHHRHSPSLRAAKGRSSRKPAAALVRTSGSVTLEAVLAEDGHNVAVEVDVALGVFARWAAYAMTPDDRNEEWGLTAH